MHEAHEFEIVIKGGRDDLTDALVDRLFEAGCGDALVGCRGDVIYLTFARRAATRSEAIASAVADVRRAGCTVMVVLRWAEAGR